MTCSALQPVEGTLILLRQGVAGNNPERTEMSNVVTAKGRGPVAPNVHFRVCFPLSEGWEVKCLLTDDEVQKLLLSREGDGANVVLKAWFTPCNGHLRVKVVSVNPGRHDSKTFGQIYVPKAIGRARHASCVPRMS